MKWKIIDEDRAKKLLIEEIPIEGLLKIDVTKIPPSFSIKDYINYIKQEGIVMQFGE